MKKLKKIIKFFGIIFLILILFKGLLYRNLINYSKIDKRKNNTISNPNLIVEIEKQTEGKVLNIEDIIKISHNITSDALKFTFEKSLSNPNLVFDIKKANCVGYSSLFNAIGNYLIVEQNLTDTYEINHFVGKLDFLGFDIHLLFKNSFLKNHDFNEIREKKTGIKTFVDPSLRDYLRIENITSK